MMTDPPRWADRILEWYCRDEILEDLQGDLHEVFRKNIREKGLLRARLIYIVDVIKFFRFYTVKQFKPESIMQALILLLSYWKTSLRNITRTKLFSLINLSGLAISMSTGILMIVLLAEIHQFDMMHEKRDRIFRVINTFKNGNDAAEPCASTSPLVAQKLAGLDAVDKVVLMRRNASGDFQFEDKTIPLGGFWASTDFLDVFSFEVLEGDPQTALRDPNTIVLTETTSQKLFGNVSALGKSLHGLNDNLYTVTAVVKDPPLHSHLQFDFLASFVTFEENRRAQGDESLYDWSNMWMYYTYILLNDVAQKTRVDQFLEKINQEENKRYKNTSYSASLQRLTEIVPGPNLSNQTRTRVNINMIWILLALSVIVVLSACFNYTNLSIARSLGRAREVGIRKVIGATRGQVLTQFVMEAIVFSLFAMVLALGLFFLIRPYFLSIGEFDLPVNLDFKIWYLVPVSAFAVMTGFLAGFLPSLVLSKIKAIIALKDVTRIRLFSGINLRIVLMVFQFTIAMAMIIATIISYRQYRFAVNFDLGYDTENVLNIEAQGNDSRKLALEFSRIPGVQAVSRSIMIPSTGDSWGNYVKHIDPADSTIYNYNLVDENYLTLHNFTFLAGRNFKELPEGSVPKEIIVNEEMLRRFDLGDPIEAIGKQLTLLDEGAYQITGVVADFQFKTIDSGNRPFVFKQSTEDYAILNLKLRSNDMQQLMGQLQDTWKRIDQVHPFEAEFFDDRIEEAYAEYTSIIKIVGFLSLLSISISVLGLLGMTIFLTQSRLREISIRKILGASESSLALHLSRTFLSAIIISGLIAAGLTYYFFEVRFLSNFAHRINIGILDLGSGLIIISLIALCTMGWHLIKVVRANPATILRSE
ncbi:MAG: ABC transporter permease [Saprospiraceae bacterium]|nr:ABC transporter permease [Saprospiraceae bacterium]